MYFVTTTDPRTYAPGKGMPFLAPEEALASRSVMFKPASDQVAESGGPQVGQVQSLSQNPQDMFLKNAQQSQKQSTQVAYPKQLQEQTTFNSPLTQLPGGRSNTLVAYWPEQPPQQPGKPELSHPAAGQSAFQVKQVKPVKQPPEPVAPAKPGKEEKQKESKAKPPQENRTSDLVGAFKILYALIAAGAINAFLFGTPLLVAGGLSVAFALTQVGLAKVIERKIIDKSDDRTPGAREKAMAPVWGGIAAGLALVESGLNDLYERYNGKPKQTIDDTLKLLKQHRDQASSFMKPLYNAQIYGVNLRKQLESPVQKGATQPKAAVAKIVQLSTKYLKGNKPFAYSCSAITSFIGGYIQLHMAAQLQDGIDKHQGKFK